MADIFDQITAPAAAAPPKRDIFDEIAPPAPTGEGPQLRGLRKFQHPMSQIVYNLSRRGLIPRLLEPKPSDPNLAVLDTRGPVTQEPVLPLEEFSPVRGPQRGALEFAGGLTTPENLALLVGTAGLGKVKNVGPALGRLASAGFSADMIYNSFREDPEWIEAYERGDKLVMSEIATKKILQLWMGLEAGKHAAVPKAPTAPVVERAVPKAEAAPPPIPDKALEVVRAAPKDAPIAAKYVSDEMGISRSAALDVLKGLQEAGHLEERGGRYYRVAAKVEPPPVAPREPVTPIPIEEVAQRTEEARARQRPVNEIEPPDLGPFVPEYQPQPTPMTWQEAQRLRRGMPGPPSEPAPLARPPIEQYRTQPRVPLEEIVAEREQRAAEAGRQEQLRLDEAAAEVERQRDLDEMERQQRERDRLTPPARPLTWQEQQEIRRRTPEPVLPEPAPSPPPKSKQARMQQRAAAKKAKAAEPAPVVEPAPPPAPEVIPTKEAVRDLEDQARLPGEERKGQEPVQAEPVERAGGEEAPAGGVLQEAQEVAPPIEPAPAPVIPEAPPPSPKSKQARLAQRKPKEPEPAPTASTESAMLEHVKSNPWLSVSDIPAGPPNNPLANRSAVFDLVDQGQLQRAYDKEGAPRYAPAGAELPKGFTKPLAEAGKPSVKDFLESESGTMRLPEWLEKRIRGEKTEPVPERETERKELGGKTLGPYEGKPRMLTEREKAQAREEAVGKAEFYIKYLDKPRERSYAQKYAGYLKGERKSPPLRIGLHDSKARLIRLNLDSAFDAGEFAPKAGPGPLPPGSLRTEPLEETFRREAFEQKLTQPPPGMRKTMGPDTGPREPSELPRPARKVLGAAEDFLESESGEFRPERLKELAAKGKEALEEYGGMIASPLRSRIRRAGKGAGKPLMEAITRSQRGRTAAAERLTNLKDGGLMGLSREEALNLQDAMEGREKAMNPDVERALVVARELTDDIAGRATDLGVEVRGSEGKEAFQAMENYFPHHIPKVEQLKKGPKRADVIENLQRQGIRVGEEAATKFLDEYVNFVENIKRNPGEALIEYLQETGQAKDRADAIGRLTRHRQGRQGPRRQGSIEYEREADLPFYDPDPRRVLPAHAVETSIRLEQIAELGQDNQILNKHLENIWDASGKEKADEVRGHVDKMLGWIDEGNTRIEKVSRAARAIQTARLGFAQIPNAWQGFTNSATKAELPAAFAGLRGMMTKEGRRFAQESGATMEQTLREMLQDLPGGNEQWVEKAARKYLKGTGFTATEQGNRYLSANAAKNWSTRMLVRLRRSNGTDKFARETLEELGVDPDVALKRGKLTASEMLNAARKFSDITQFESTPEVQPGWATHPIGKMVWQFKNFGYQQVRFMFDQTAGEIAKGRVGRGMRNLFYMTVLFPSIAGEVTVWLRNLIWGRKRKEKNIPERLINNIVAYGSLGTVTDVLESGRFGRGKEFIAGPSFSDLGEIVDIAGSKSPKQAGQRTGKFVGRHFPPAKAVYERLAK